MQTQSPPKQPAHPCPGEGDRARTSPSPYTLTMVVGCCTLALLAIKLSGQDPVLVAQIRAIVGTNSQVDPLKSRQYLDKDPVPNSSIPRTLAGQKVLDYFAQTSVAGLLISIGDCAGCTKGNIQEWMRTAKQKGLPVLFLSTGSSGATKGFLGNIGVNGAPFVCDSNMSFASYLNPYFSARSYLITPGGRLIWSQKVLSDPTYDPLKDATALAAMKKERDEQQKRIHAR